MTAGSEDFDTYIAVFDASENLIGEDDDGGTQGTNRASCLWPRKPVHIALRFGLFGGHVRQLFRCRKGDSAAPAAHSADLWSHD
ncbi:MAG: hypothetical protein HZY74_08995 [Brevundimonas sp.]|nr:MAG: hypothetical protein HZY74_08995 [Brevundimonas sp.]